MSETAPTGNDDLLRKSQDTIDEAKAAAADVVDTEDDSMVGEDLPATDGGAAADDGAPAA
ncbi:MULTISPECIES: hypothetical protein [unclassified Curtobacterium]|uniref:hypothetical protein n=1 Tax=unclassified Curtobacterium TaxID=257496 RepID=UPI00226B7C57|nr:MULTISPECIES: hypothetical protein [unclassified Curtobacterium]